MKSQDNEYFGKFVLFLFTALILVNIWSKDFLADLMLSRDAYTFFSGALLLLTTSTYLAVIFYGIKLFQSRKFKHQSGQANDESSEGKTEYASDESLIDDEGYSALLDKARSGELLCRDAKAYSYVVKLPAEQNITVSQEYRTDFIDRINNGEKPSVYVYPRNNEMIVVGGHKAYEMYRREKINRFEVVVISNFENMSGVVYTRKPYKLNRTEHSSGATSSRELVKNNKDIMQTIKTIKPVHWAVIILALLVIFYFAYQQYTVYSCNDKVKSMRINARDNYMKQHNGVEPRFSAEEELYLEQVFSYCIRDEGFNP